MCTLDIQVGDDWSRMVVRYEDGTYAIWYENHSIPEQIWVAAINALQPAGAVRVLGKFCEETGQFIPN